MTKAAIIILADAESHGDLARAVNALETAKAFQQAGDDVSVIFDGAGTRWVGKFANPEHRAHKLYESVGPSISGACGYCAGAFGVKNEVEEAGVALLEEHDRHPSIRRLVVDGYEVITF